jgi:glycosyltransferase involved in cell wall biosynthesis
MTQILWVMREIPIPVNSGDRLYSLGLVRSLAAAGHRITVLAIADPAGPPPDLNMLPRGVDWRLVPGRPRGRVRSLFSLMPLIAKRFDTPANRQLLRQELDHGEIDVVVLDNYSSVWALSKIRARHELVATIAHDFETQVTLDIYRRYHGNPLKKLALLLNALKTREAEKRLTKTAALVVTITEADARRFDAAGARSVITITPGYDGPRTDRDIDETIERRVVLFGSYNWIAKQMNLRAFLAVADSRFYERGIQLDIVGSLPAALQTELEPALRATKIWGFVDDPTTIFRSARLGVVPEMTGGGFKLKVLDYIFAGLPVSGLSTALAALPADIRRYMLIAENMEGLVNTICETIDDIEHLNILSRGAMAQATQAFDWLGRGRQISAALDEALEKQRSVAARRDNRRQIDHG